MSEEVSKRLFAITAEEKTFIKNKKQLTTFKYEKKVY